MVSMRMYIVKKTTHPGPLEKNVSLAPVTPDQAMAGLLGVKPGDLKKLEAQKAGGKKK